MDIVWTVIGFALLGLTVVDVFLTILGSRSGPMTKAWSSAVWRALLATHERRPMHRVLSLAGPAIVAVTVLVWYLVLTLGSWLILIAHRGSVVSSSTRAPADEVQTLYFVPVTISGLGYGDLVPSGWPWTTFATAVSLTGTIVLTGSLSYIISVVGAAIRRRAYARSVFGLGDEPAAIIPRLRLEDPVDSMHDYLASIASSLTDISQQQLNYPVLRYFHTVEKQSSPSVATLLLADTLYLMTHSSRTRSPAPGLAAILDSSIQSFTTIMSSRHGYVGSQADRAEPMIRRAEGLDVDTSAGSPFDSGLDEYLARRDELLGVCRDDGWGPSQAT